MREDLLGNAGAQVPSLYNYSVQNNERSLYNTPPTFTWYMAGLVFKWIKKQGGISAMESNSERRSSKLYEAIDKSDFYANPIEQKFRSRMNVPFTLKDEGLNESFLIDAQEAGLMELKGHRSVGGMRASLYNAQTDEAVDALIAYMQHFEQRTMETS